MRVLLSVLFIALTATVEAAKPNIIVILADDLGYRDVGFTGCEDFETPHIDALARAGVVCTSGYANHPFCAPTRAALMSGRYQQRFGFETNPAQSAGRDPKAGLPKSETTIATRLKAAGYTTCAIGKWHLGHHADHHPLNRGFDTFFGMLSGGHDYFEVDSRETAATYKHALVDDTRFANVEGYLTHQFTDKALEFIAGAKDQPFFLYLAYNAPHAPWQAPQETIDSLSHIEHPLRRAYAAMIVEMDRDIGRVVDAVEARGLAENTLIFFLSDNGGPNVGTVTDNAPYRGQKGDVYEGGVHVPFSVTWPGTLPAGQTFGSPVIALDVTATAAAVGGANADRLEGKNLIPFLAGKTAGAPHDYIFFRRRDGAAWAVIDKKGKKLVKPDWQTNEVELYHLADDAGEANDLLDQAPEEVQRLQAAYDAWNAGNIRYTFLDFHDWQQKIDAWHAEQRNFDD